MNAPFRVREAIAADVPAVIEMFGALDDQHTAGVPHKFRGSSDEPRSLQFVTDLLQNPMAAILVAETAAGVAGQIVVELREVPDQSPWVPHRYAQVHDLVVVPEARRQGIGRALMIAAERWTLERGVNSVELIVWDFNRDALRLYERLGYGVEFRRLRRVLR